MGVVDSCIDDADQYALTGKIKQRLILKLQDAGMLRNMLSSGLSMGFMSSLVNIGTLTLQTSINKLGQNIIIAHTAARKISEIFMIMFSVFGQTMATYCGQNLGAGKIERIRRGILLATGYTCIWCTLNIVTGWYGWSPAAKLRK